MGRDHPATCRSGQTFIVVHARVNQREEVYHTPFSLHIAHGHVEMIIHSYIDYSRKKGREINSHLFFHLLCVALQKEALL